MEFTLKGVEDGEDVVGGYDQRAVAEESKGPGEAQQEEQAQNGHGVGLDGAAVLGFRCRLPHERNVVHDHNERSKSEEEHHTIITNVHSLVDDDIRNPAPGNHEEKSI